jgi:phage shock protein A
MSKHGIIGRVTQLARANIKATIDSAQDPPEVLDQLVRDYTATIAEAEQAAAQLADNLRIAEADQHEDASVVVQWGKNAAAASQTADELRATGGAAEADRFDNLARVALQRQLVAEDDVESIWHTITAQHESIDKLKNGLDQMQVKLSELMTRRESTPGRRSRTGPRQDGQAPGAPRGRQHRQHREDVRSTDIMDPASDAALFGEQVRRETARVRGRPENQAAQSPDQTFASLGEVPNQAEIDERLQAMKAGRAMAAAKARAEDQPSRHDHPFR